MREGSGAGSRSGSKRPKTHTDPTEPDPAPDPQHLWLVYLPFPGIAGLTACRCGNVCCAVSPTTLPGLPPVTIVPLPGLCKGERAVKMLIRLLTLNALIIVVVPDTLIRIRTKSLDDQKVGAYSFFKSNFLNEKRTSSSLNSFVLHYFLFCMSFLLFSIRVQSTDQQEA